MANEAGTKPQEAPSAGAQLLKLAVEVGPLAVFFIINWRTQDSYWATGRPLYTSHAADDLTLLALAAP